MDGQRHRVQTHYGSNFGVRRENVDADPTYEPNRADDQRRRRDVRERASLFLSVCAMIKTRAK